VWGNFGEKHPSPDAQKTRVDLSHKGRGEKKYLKQFDFAAGVLLKSECISRMKCLNTGTYVLRAKKQNPGGESKLRNEKPKEIERN